ncbi:uncharacterized protein LOC130998530 [Salvia miltiorrhiza]|uniref:uncharacterized protein LOC130998530 n=1 Tax=Salvia miltiorrhiza TaxID=226208 RepID=UPI0025ABD59A|nr:uncharacterized protein LOC130998530 [Salvia miltiorrhiza]
MSLLEMKQGSNETRGEFVARFTKASLEVPRAKSQIKGYAFARGLRPGAFCDNLQIRQPRDFEDILARLPNHTQLEEARAARKAEQESSKLKKAEGRAEQVDNHFQGRAPYRGLPPRAQGPRAEQGARVVNNVNRLHDQTPLNRSQEEIFHLIKNEPYFRAPRDYAEGATRPGPNNLLCQYHNHYGHPTEYCGHLRHQLEVLVSQGKLDQFVKQTPPLQQHNNAYPDRAAQNQGNRGGGHGATPSRENKRQVYMIIGEDDGPTSNRAQKQAIHSTRAGTYPRHVMSVRTAEREPNISFRPGDHAGLIHLHDDALVFSADVANYTVHRIFIDSGSAVNIIYKDCLTAMALNAALNPPGNPLYRFTGESITPLGSIELPMTWGKEGASRTQILKFLVVDFPKPSCNIIVGRPALNAFQAVISMYHLKMKFTLEGGGIEEVVGNQITSKECFVRSLTAQTGGKRSQNE